MNIKSYLIETNKNICQLDLNADNSNSFLDNLTLKINEGYNFFIFSFSALNDAYAFDSLKRARQLVAEYGGLFIISGRADFAFSLKADGIYLDDNHLNFKVFSEFFSENFIIVSKVNSRIIADVYVE